MRFFKLFLMVPAMALFTACASTGQGSGTAGTEANDAVFASTEARRDFLTSHVFEGRWSSGHRSGDSKLVFEEVADQLVVSLYDVDGDGTAYDATVSSSNGAFRFQITEDNRWNLAFTSEKTLEGTQWYEGYRVDITLNDLSPRANMPDPAPVYPVNSAEELADLLADHSPFAGKWRWGTAKSAPVEFNFQQDGDDDLSVKAMIKSSEGGVTNITVPVSIEEASTGNNRISFETSSWGPIFMKLRKDGIHGVIKYSDGTALRLHLLSNMDNSLTDAEVKLR